MEFICSHPTLELHKVRDPIDLLVQLRQRSPACARVSGKSIFNKSLINEQVAEDRATLTDSGHHICLFDPRGRKINRTWDLFCGRQKRSDLSAVRHPS